MSAEAAAAWEQLPLGVQQHILVLTGNPRARRVCKAWRNAFDAMNHKLSFRHGANTEQSLKTAATAAATQVVRNSPSLTAVNLMDCDDDSPLHSTLPLTLSDLLAGGAASGLATRLCKLTGVLVDPECAVQQLQALRQCTGLTHLGIISGSEPEDWQSEGGHQIAVDLTAALQGMHMLMCLRLYNLQFEGSEAALASALQHLTQLQHLQFCCSGLGEAGVAALAPALSAMPGLQTLDVSYNALEGVEGAQALCGLLDVVPGLTHLNISGIAWEEEGAALLAPVLQGMTCLQTLNLNDTSIGDGGMAILAPALAALPHLHTLDLRCNDFRSMAFSALQPVLAREGSHLRKLDIGQNWFKLESARALAEGLGAATQLLGLSFELGDDDWVAVAPALGCLAPSLQALKLGCDSVNAAGSAALAAVLQQLTGLTCLEVCSTSSSVAMVTISPALMGMRRLQVLDLYFTAMTVEDITALSAVLPACGGSLTHLTLSDCNIDADVAANALAPALAQATTLVSLQLGGNAFGPQGAQWLVPVLSALPHLREVDLSSCDLGAQACVAVAQAVMKRDGIVLVLRDNGFIEGGAFEKALRGISGVNVQCSTFRTCGADTMSRQA